MILVVSKNLPEASLMGLNHSSLLQSILLTLAGDSRFTEVNAASSLRRAGKPLPHHFFNDIGGSSLSRGYVRANFCGLSKHSAPPAHGKRLAKKRRALRARGKK